MSETPAPYNIDNFMPGRKVVENALHRKKDEWLHLIKIGGRHYDEAKFAEGEIYSLLWFLGYSHVEIPDMLDKWAVEIDGPEWQDWKCPLCGQVMPYTDAEFHLRHQHNALKDTLP